MKMSLLPAFALLFGMCVMITYASCSGRAFAATTPAPTYSTGTIWVEAPEPELKISPKAQRKIDRELQHQTYQRDKAEQSQRRTVFI